MIHMNDSKIPLGGAWTARAYRKGKDWGGALARILRHPRFGAPRRRIDGAGSLWPKRRLMIRR